MCKMKISVKYAENFLMFDLLLTSGFKIQNIPILACHVESVYPKCHLPFRVFDKLKSEIQNSILRFCFCFNKERRNSNN